MTQQWRHPGQLSESNSDKLKLFSAFAGRVLKTLLLKQELFATNIYKP